MNLLVAARPAPQSPNAVAPAIPLTPLPRASEPVPPSPPAPLPQGPQDAVPLGFHFDKAEQIEATDFTAKKGLCSINPASNLTKRYLWVYLWFEQTDINAIAKLFGEIVLYRSNTPIGKFPFGDVFPATNHTGQSILNPSWGGAPGSGMGPNSLEIRPKAPSLTEPVMSIISPIEFNAEIDRAEANISEINSNVSSYRLILACLSTSP